MRYCLLIVISLITITVVGSSPVFAVDNPGQPSVLGSSRESVSISFPELYLVEELKTIEQAERSRPYGVSASFDSPLPVISSPTKPPVTRLQSSEKQLTSPDPSPKLTDLRSIIQKDDILAFYGSPLTSKMGILGAYPIMELNQLLTELAEKYDAVNGQRGVRKAFYLVYGTVWPEGEIGILKDDIVMEYINYALENDLLVFLDHQIGKYSVVSAIKQLLPFLKYPNVHLAMDPEWRTTKPMLEIGSVSADELNEVQQIMDDYLRVNELPGERLLIIHQFNWRMIQNREQVRADFERVRFVHCADGFGPPSMKRESYRYNAQATNLPVKGFKLFFKGELPGAGYDEPLMTPEEVLALEPRPLVIMYQ